jgi:starch-binding outer membrane protein, SusD/RagB family
MKRYLYILLLTITAGNVSCKKDFLDEEPESFLSTGNAFKTEADFNASVYNLYSLVRSHYYTLNDFNPFWYDYRTDGFWEITVTTPNLAGEIAATTTAITNFAWAPHYKIISEANTILHRLPTSVLTKNCLKQKLSSSEALPTAHWAIYMAAFHWYWKKLNHPEPILPVPPDSRYMRRPSTT